MLLRCVFLWNIVAGLATAANNVGPTDFDLHPSYGGEYEFIYHAKHELFLTIYKDACYFAYMEEGLHNDIGNNRIQTSLEEQVKAIIADPLPSQRKRATTISEMRDRYTDLLADFHCLNKDIYDVKPDLVKRNEPHWQLHKGDTDTPLTGPSGGVDHTLGTAQGQYLYMEATSINPGTMMDLVSPVLNADGGLCLRFWYNMDGRGIGGLEILAKDPNDAAHSRLLWSLTDDQGNGWKLAEVSVSDTWQYRHKMQLHVLAKRGSENAGDIAIDDISSEPGVCIPGLFDCSFENGNVCKWDQVNVLDKMDWTINQGQTPTTGTGPDKALHLNNVANQHYLFMNGADGYASYTADLQSSVLQLDQPVCLTFYFFMKGTDVKELDVIVLDRTTMHESTVWSRTGNVHGQTNAWEKATVDIRAPDPNTPVQVIIRAIRGDSPLSDIAIDLLHGLSGSCSQYNNLASAVPIG